jgi:Ni,Fe-hydrogenase III large subunit
MESLAGMKVSGRLQQERCIALEMERIAMHIGDTAALCADIAYQFGQSVNEALRTLVINAMQQWCGNRFGKGMIRTGGSHYLIDQSLADHILSVLKEVEERYFQATALIFSMPSVLSRFESTGRVTPLQARLLGAVGMAARSSGIRRDIRWSHPFQAYHGLKAEPVVLTSGDVLARAMIRRDEIRESIRLIRDLMPGAGAENVPPDTLAEHALSPDSLAISVTEGWRGEIVHLALTDEAGKISAYKVKDPSLHNWMALSLAVRNQEISDFPLCNKSFNLSYCGHDL